MSMMKRWLEAIAELVGEEPTLRGDACKLAQLLLKLAEKSKLDIRVVDNTIVFNRKQPNPEPE